MQDSATSLPKAVAHKRRRIATSLRELIASLEVGDRLPSGPELVRHFGVARSTIEAAVSELAAEGLIVRRQGAGTFVAKMVPSEATRRTHVNRIAIVSAHLSPTREIFGAMAAGLEAQIRNNGYEPALILEADIVARFVRVQERWEAGEFDGYIHIGSLPDVPLPLIPGVVMGEVAPRPPYIRLW